MLAGAGDEEKRYVLRVTCLREHENAVRQLLLNIAQQQRFTLQDCSRRRRTPRTIWRFAHS